MLTLLLFLLILIAVWSVIVRIAFPGAGDSADKYLLLVKKHHPLLRQIVEAALDKDRWPGLMETEEVRSLLEEGDIVNVSAIGQCVEFQIRSDVRQEKRAVLYQPDTACLPPSLEGCGLDWTYKGEADGLQTWTSPAGARLTLRALEDQFYLEDIWLPS